MKKLQLLFYLMVLTTFVSLSQNKEVLTLSKGRYNEIPTYNKYEQVGSVIMDIGTKTIAGFVDRDTLLLSAISEPDVTTRFFTTDAFAEKYYSLTPYQYAANNPILYIDINGDSLAVFNNQTNEFVGFEDDGKENWTGITRKYDKSGNPVTDKKGNYKTDKTFGFNDDKTDIQAIRNKAITKVEFISDEKIDKRIEYSGVRSADEGYSFALKQSRGGSLDFGVKCVDSGSLSKNTFYVTDGSAYNVADFGNYLWGMGMAELRIPLDIAKFSAHVNNFINGKSDMVSVYEFGKGTYNTPGLLDSPADQRAIVKGHTRVLQQKMNKILNP